METSVPVCIRLGLEEFERRPQGQIVGPIWMELGGEPFPEVAWSDFPVVVLEWWLRAIRDILTSGVSSAQLDFMDGPYGVLLRVQSSSQWHLQRVEPCACAERASEDSMRGFEWIDAKQFISECLMIANEALRFCMGQDWQTPDLVALDRIVRQVRALRADTQGDCGTG